MNIGNHTKEKMKEQAKKILGSMSQESRKKMISQMFDTLRNYNQNANPKYEDFLEEVSIWDD